MDARRVKPINRRSVVGLGGAAMVGPIAQSSFERDPHAAGEALKREADSLVGKANRDGSNIIDAARFRINTDTVHASELASLLGAARVGFSQDDPGALTRTLLDRGRDSIRATDYAKGGGIGASNDTAGLTAALVHCQLAGKDLYVPAVDGGFNITDALTIPAGVRLHGPGTIRQRTANRNVVILASDVRIEGLTIQGTGLTDNTEHSSGGQPCNVGVLVPAGTRNVRVQGCNISGCEGSGIYDAGARNVWYKDNFLHDNTWGHRGPHRRSYASAADILFNSGTAGSGVVEVTGNRCVSNNSQGIAFALLGLGRDAIIAHNFIDVWGADGERIPYASGDLRRRHGIITNYLSQGGAGRVVVHHNMIFGTLWSGVYTQASTRDNGPMLIESNLIVDCGWDTTSALSGGVYTVARGKAPIVIRSNIVVDFKNTAGGSGAFAVSSSSDGSNHVRYEDNHVVGSLGRGYAIVNYADDVTITGGSIRGCVMEDIAITLTAGTSAASGLRIEGVAIERGAGVAPMILYQPSSDTPFLVVTGCRLKGIGKDTVSPGNVAVLTTRPTRVSVTNNDISDVYRAVDSTGYLALGTRSFADAAWDHNRLRNVGIGFGLGATAPTSVFPVCGNLFDNVGKRLDGGSANGFPVLYEARRIGGSLEIYDLNSAPTAGTWAAGDEAVFSGAGAGSAPRARCVSGGTPGVWKSYAALEA